MQARVRKFTRKVGGRGVVAIDYSANEKGESVTVSEFDNRRSAVLGFLTTLAPQDVYAVTECDDDNIRSTLVFYRAGN